MADSPDCTLDVRVDRCPYAQAECEDTRQHNLEGAAGHANLLFQPLVRFVGRAVCMPIVERRGTVAGGGIVVAW